MSLNEAMQPWLALDFCDLSQIGGRDSNQDACDHAIQGEVACFVVSDGAGGHKGGEVAAQLVIQSIIARFAAQPAFGVKALRSYIDHAIAQVAEKKREDHQLKDMSATVAVVLIDQKNHGALWAHMGDTRAYLFRRGKLLDVTRDHSLVQQLIDAGLCQYDQLRRHPLRSTLFAAIGAEGDTEPAVRQNVLAVQDGDALLLCTDGFWEWISEEDMEKELARSTTAEEWMVNMCAIAQQNSSQSSRVRDNFTAYTIWLGEPAIVTLRIE